MFKLLNACTELTQTSSSQKFILLALCNYANENGYTCVSIKTLIKFTSLSRRQVFNILKELEEKQYLIRVKMVDDNNYQRSNAYYINLLTLQTHSGHELLYKDILDQLDNHPDSLVNDYKKHLNIKQYMDNDWNENCATGVHTLHGGGAQVARGGCTQCTPLNLLDKPFKDPNNINSKVDKDLAFGKQESTKKIFDYWKEKMNKKNAKLLEPRRRSIERALKSYREDVLINAIDGCAKSKWHMGENDQSRKYNDIEFIFRINQKQNNVERFAEYSKTSVPQSFNEKLDKFMNND